MATSAFPYVQAKTILNTSFPAERCHAAPPPFTTTPPVSYLAVVDPNHVLPRTYEWNAAVERTFGKADVLTVTYLGAAGRKLMRQDIYNAPNPNFTGEFDLMRNDADSSYQGAASPVPPSPGARSPDTALLYLGAFDRRCFLRRLLPECAAGRCGSSERGSSDYDIRQTFSGAVSYNIPGAGQRNLESDIWELVDGFDRLRSHRAPGECGHRTRIPSGGILSGASSVQRPNLVPGVPLWIADPNVAGGKEINPAAFTIPTGAVQGDLGRNALRGFGATEVDLTLRRQFKLRERLALQARADFFNIFNHPNFGPPINYLSSPLFGQSTQMLGASLGSGGQNGGLNPLYQIGGPRSAQLALKMIW